ncbi:MAG: PQQ-dependent sugar dehydrogenase [Alphaproteobacteria bacterium]|nr:PQQ-dependent sugar dehydrogenase [Alphaproteobacteria bacterium]MCZ6844882.1 PQQ-dependent sugar dehydrogenase [Alphaproteobacteria bacterium]
MIFPTSRILSGLTFVVAIAVSAPAHTQIVNSQKQAFRPVVVAAGLEHPWSMAFLPDGRVLVTERPGRLRLIVNGRLQAAPVSGVPKVVARGQGGLLDVVLHPDYADNGWIYLSFAAPSPRGAHTAVVRARLDGNRLVDLKTIFRANNVAGGRVHFGSRLAFGGDGKLYVTVGERGDSDRAQDLDSHNGTTVRLNDDGTVPGDNPFLNTAGALPETYSYGHRNSQGMARHPVSGDIWLNEHGPQGGDEINIVRAGVNYGWPVITYGRSYAGFSIGEGSEKPGMAQPILHWTPSIAPSGMAFYTGDKFPAWRGNLFVGSLKFRHLVRLELDGERVVSQERLLEGAFGRVRDVRQGPDGLLYLLTDENEGALIRLEPASN